MSDHGARLERAAAIVLIVLTITGIAAAFAAFFFGGLFLAVPAFALPTSFGWLIWRTATWATNAGRHDEPPLP